MFCLKPLTSFFWFRAVLTNTIQFGRFAFPLFPILFTITDFDDFDRDFAFYTKGERFFFGRHPNIGTVIIALIHAVMNGKHLITKQ